MLYLVYSTREGAGTRTSLDVQVRRYRRAIRAGGRHGTFLQEKAEYMTHKMNQRRIGDSLRVNESGLLSFP